MSQDNQVEPPAPATFGERRPFLDYLKFNLPHRSTADFISVVDLPTCLLQPAGLDQLAGTPAQRLCTLAHRISEHHREIRALNLSIPR